MWMFHDDDYFKITPVEKQRVCCNCRHDKRTVEGNICDIDYHRIGYIACFAAWCKHWASDEAETKASSSETPNSSTHDSTHPTHSCVKPTLTTHGVCSDHSGDVTEMVDDFISRQAAIRWVKTECNPYGKPTLDFESGKRVIEHLEQMPSADRPKGKRIWSPKDEDGTVSGCCSNCSFSHLFIGGHTAQYNYCPNCGAKMEVQNE